MKQSKGYVHKEKKNISHPTERYDHVVPNQYKEKAFSKKSKSGLYAKPNDFGHGLEELREGF